MKQKAIDLFNALSRISKLCIVLTALLILYFISLQAWRFTLELKDAYTEYRSRQDIIHKDNLKKEFIASNSGVIKDNLKLIKELQDNNTSLTSCNARIKFGDHNLPTCDTPTIPKASASEIINNIEDVSKYKKIPGTNITLVNDEELLPKDLFYTTSTKDKCSISQTEMQHFKANKRLATDVACGFKATLYAPDYNNQVKEYVVEYKSYPDTGNTLILHFEDKGIKFFWLLGHIKANDFTKVITGQIIGEMDMSGVSTGYHSHIELWQGDTIDNGIKVSYSSSTRALINLRQGKLDDTVKKGDPIYFTSYNMGDVKQNDSTPYIPASGIDLRSVKNPIALTVDVRNLYGIKFGDKIKLDGPCSGIYSVHDEKNPRFRYSCIKEQGYCNKGDIAIPLGTKGQCSGVYKISKI